MIVLKSRDEIEKMRAANQIIREVVERLAGEIKPGVKTVDLDRIAEEMSRNFHEGRFRDGIIHGVRRVGEVLAAHVPRRPDDTNELPDKVNVD